MILFKLLSYFLGYNTFDFLERVRNRLVSYSIQRKLKKCGNGLSIAWPLSISGAKNITIGDNFNCNKNARIDAISHYNGTTFYPNIVIGDNVIINPDVHLAAINKIVIGNNVLMASGVFISDHSHGQIDKEEWEVVPALRTLFSKGPVMIGDNVWIGENVVILAGVTIGNGAIIGANSVVTRNVDANAIVAGVPARVINKNR
jgi:acetyltransferase-like isoleucine patch superfamily enzyme